jgi:hypothetical protein
LVRRSSPIEAATVPVKQRILKERIPQFSTGTLQLFAKLEATPPRERKSRQFRDDERRLAEMLGLETEWWGGAFCVITCSRRNPFRLGLAGHEYWFKCREIRELLLAMSPPGVEEELAAQHPAG